MDGNWIPTKADGVIEAQVDGDRVLMSPKQFDYFGLAETGTEVWDLIDGTRTLDDIVEALQPEFDAGPQQIRADVTDFIAALNDAGLLSSMA